MTDAISFWMGSYEARFPADRHYAKNHLWLKRAANATPTYRVGFTAYSVRLLRDVYFLDWTLAEGTEVSAKQPIGEIESSKAVSTLFAPSAGTILRFNEALLDDPAGINVDNYGAGWLFEFASTETFLSPAEYLGLLEAGWEETQRMIKKQMNQQ